VIDPQSVFYRGGRFVGDRRSHVDVGGIGPTRATSPAAMRRASHDDASVREHGETVLVERHRVPEVKRVRRRIERAERDLLGVGEFWR
jgi:hypothetical protein